MTLENVKLLRENFKANGLGIILINDNLQIFNSLNNFFLWDDEKQIISVLRVNNTRYRAKAPMEIIVTEYDHIQFMNSYIMTEKVEDLIKGLDNDQATPEFIKKVQDYIANELDPIDLVYNKEYTKTNPMSRDNTLPGDSFDDSTWVNISYGTDSNTVLFRNNVMKISDYFNYAPAAISAAQTYALSIGRRFDSWNKTEEEILTEINAAVNSGNGIPMIKVVAKFKF